MRKLPATNLRTLFSHYTPWHYIGFISATGLRTGRRGYAAARKNRCKKADGKNIMEIKILVSRRPHAECVGSYVNIRVINIV